MVNVNDDVKPADDTAVIVPNLCLLLPPLLIAASPICTIGATPIHCTPMPVLTVSVTVVVLILLARPDVNVASAVVALNNYLVSASGCRCKALPGSVTLIFSACSARMSGRGPDLEDVTAYSARLFDLAASVIAVVLASVLV